jgi:CDP-diacylglycerol--serine O-phosphatidyltransferase
MSDLFPPFAPDPVESRRRLFKPVPFRTIAPNLITLIALCLGLTAIRLAYEGRLEPAVIMIVIAAALDGVDGRVARLLKGTSRFGAELDSLSDFVNFGVAPALVLYSFVLHQLRAAGWIAALVFAIAAGLRLARFNVMLDDPSRPEWKKNFFVGMAAPAGAITSLLPIYLYFLDVPIGTSLAPLAVVWAIYVLAIAFLMVSNIPTFSGKTMGKRVPREWVLPLFVVTVAFFGLLVSFPFQVLAAGTLIYLALIPVGVAHYRKLERADRSSHPAEAEAPAAPTAPALPPDEEPGEVKRPLH